MQVHYFEDNGIVYHSPSHPFSLSTKGQIFNKENMFSFIKYALTLGICIPIALHFISLKMNKEDTQMFEKASQNFNSSTFIFFFIIHTYECTFK